MILRYAENAQYNPIETKIENMKIESIAFCPKGEISCVSISTLELDPSNRLFRDYSYDYINKYYNIESHGDSIISTRYSTGDILTYKDIEVLVIEGVISFGFSYYKLKFLRHRHSEFVGDIVFWGSVELKGFTLVINMDSELDKL